MKQKLIFAALALGLGLFAASCNKAELVSTGDDVLATFTISTPGTMTKAETAGKGESVDKVKCVTFDDAGAEIAALTQTVPIASKKATYSTRLVKGQAYRVAFFAYNEAAAAYDLTDLKNITVKGTQPANAEGRDAFTAFVDISATDTEAPISKEVHLYRPFAQLNIACSASDFAAAAAAGITVAQSKVKISGTGVAFGAFNAYEDKVDGTAIDEVEYSLANIIAGETITVDNVTYNSLSMNYFLVGDKGEKNTATVEFEWAGSSKSGSATWTNVPLQRNYRTNIIGDILTNPAAFNITVDEPFDGDHNVDVVAKNPPVNVPAGTTIANAIASNPTAEEFALPAGSFSAPGSISDVTIKGEGDQTVIDMHDVNNNPSNCNNVTYENVKFEMGSSIYATSGYHGFQHCSNMVFKNCTFHGVFVSYENLHFVDCHFINDNQNGEYNMWAYTDGLIYEGCTFESYGKFINAYCESSDPRTISFKHCTFKNLKSTANKAAINVKTLVGNSEILQYTVKLEDCHLEGPFDPVKVDQGGTSGNNGLWMVETSTSTTTKIYVDNNQVF